MRADRAPARKRSPSWPWLGGGLALGAVIGIGAGADPRLAVVGALALAVVVTLFVRPEWLPSALVITLFVEGIALGGIEITRLVGPLAAVILVIALATRGWVGFPLKSIFVAVGAYVIWAFASALWTVAPAGTEFALASLALSITFMLAVAVLVRGRDDVRRLMVVIWGMSVLVGLVAIGSYLGGSGAAVGYTDDPNFFASTQVIALPIGVALASTVRTGWQRAVIYAGLAVGVGSIITSLSRGGLLALIGVAILLTLWPARTFFRTRARKLAFVVCVFLGGAALLFAAYGDLSERTSTLFNTTEGGSGRVNLWLAAISGWEEHPVRGLGYGAFESQSNYLLQRTPGVNFGAYRLRAEGQAVHNAYLSSLTQVGIVGLLLFLSIFVAGFATLRRVGRWADELGDQMIGTLARGLVLALVAFAMISIFLSSETDRALWVLLGLALALSTLVAPSARKIDAAPMTYRPRGGGGGRPALSSRMNVSRPQP